MKVGDKVRIKDYKDIDLSINGPTNPGFASEMKNYCGKEGVVKEVSELNNVLVYFDDGDWWVWDKDWVTLLEGPEQTATGAELIAQERLEQIEKHGYNVERDVMIHPDGKLIAAAWELTEDRALLPEGWHAPTWERMLSKPKKERLIIAGALIAAEIDRLIYLEGQEQEKQTTCPTADVRNNKNLKQHKDGKV
jgi:hypothetical protein